VHRNANPSNTLMTSDDFTYLIDFGAASTRVTKPGA
jgi:serine/threonine protein kinase